MGDDYDERHLRTEDDVTIVDDDPEREADAHQPGGGHPITVEEIVRAATRLAMGSAGMAVTSATRWQRGLADADGADAAGAAGNLASAALGLGLTAERVVVRGASAVGARAASLTWGVMRVGPLRGPIERLAERFRGEQDLSEREVADALDALMLAIGEAVVARIDIDRVIDRIALDRVLSRIDRHELSKHLGTDEPVLG